MKNTLFRIMSIVLVSVFNFSAIVGEVESTSNNFEQAKNELVDALIACRDSFQSLTDDGYLQLLSEYGYDVNADDQVKDDNNEIITPIDIFEDFMYLKLSVIPEQMYNFNATVSKKYTAGVIVQLDAILRYALYLTYCEHKICKEEWRSRAFFVTYVAAYINNIVAIYNNFVNLSGNAFNDDMNQKVRNFISGDAYTITIDVDVVDTADIAVQHEPCN